MTKKNLLNIRIYPKEKNILDNIKLDISYIEKNPKIRTPEVLRRIFNIPNLNEVLKRDAELKRRLK